MQNQSGQQNSSTGQKADQKMDQKNSSQNQQGPNGRLVVNIVVSVIIGFIIGFGVSWLWNRHHNAEMMQEAIEMTQNQNSASGTGTSPFVMAGSGISTTSAGSITVANQPAGSSVFVSTVTFGSDGGWVAIEDDDNGTPGRILGAAMFGPGSTAGEVPLLRATVADQTYFAVMRANVGNYQLFNMQTDMPLTDTSGNVVMAAFMTH